MRTQQNYHIFTGKIDSLKAAGRPAILAPAILAGAKMAGAKMAGAKMAGAKMAGAKMAGAVILTTPKWRADGMTTPKWRWSLIDQVGR